MVWKAGDCGAAEGLVSGLVSRHITEKGKLGAHRHILDLLMETPWAIVLHVSQDASCLVYYLAALH